MATDASSKTLTQMEARYQQRLSRYVTAMRNEQPDMVPIRPFAAEFTGTYAGYTCQALAHDFEQAFAAARKCAQDFDWDAVVANMVYVWTGLTETIGLKYYGVPGLGVPPNVGFQYREPEEHNAFMQPDEYDQLIEDPTGYLFHVWLPRVAPVQPLGAPVTAANNLSFLKGGMAMLQYFMAFPEQVARLRHESGTVSAIAGIFKAPMDILADKLRGYLGLVEDLHTQPKKVLAACEALMPHLYHVAKTTADPDCNVPIGYWMHRGCVPFVNFDHFNNLYWPTVKPIVEQLWADGHQTLFYAEGNWDHHLEAFATLPDRSIVYHVDQGDIFKAKRALGHKFCLSGGIPNVLLAFKPADEVRAYVKKVIEGVAQDGGYIMDASAIMQNESKVENVRAMTEATREYGQFSAGHATPVKPKDVAPAPAAASRIPAGLPSAKQPGTFLPWEQKRQDYAEVTGDEGLLARIWNGTDSFAYSYIWQLLLSF